MAEILHFICDVTENSVLFRIIPNAVNVQVLVLCCWGFFMSVGV